MNKAIIAATCIQLIKQTEEEFLIVLLFQDNDYIINNNIRAKIVEVMTNNTLTKIVGYCENVVQFYSDSTFRSHFRLTRTTFEIVLNNCARCPEFTKRDETLGGWEQISVEKTLLLVIWVLANKESYRSVADRFDVAKSQVFYCIHKVVAVILSYFCKTFVKWPTDDQKPFIAEAFSKYGLPNVIGAIDGCHIPIKRPLDNSIDYFNRKKFYSVVLQGICLPNMMFSDVDIKWPGSVHDARVLRTSDFYQYAEQLCQPKYYIIGDAAYPCREWLLCPFRNNGHLTPQQVYYNTCLSKTRVKIENAFALLKGRFRRLAYLEMKDPQHIMNTVVACCVLHNICLLDSDDVSEYILEGRDPDMIRMLPAYGNDNEDGNHLREVIMNYLWNNRRQV